MKREELKNLNLTDEQIDSIMTLHGTTVNTLKSRLSSIETERDQFKTQLDSNQTELQTLKDSAKGNEDLTAKLNDLQAKFDKTQEDSNLKLADAKKDFAIRLAFKDVNPLDEGILLNLIDKQTIKVTEENGVQGLKEQIDSLRESKPFLFQPEAKPEQETPPMPQIFTKGNPQTTPTPTGDLAQLLKSKDFNLTKYLMGENK